MILEIGNDNDKREISAILVANGYTVRKTTVLINNRRKCVIEYWKGEKENAENE